MISIKELAAQEPKGEANVFRIAVTGGGCSGFQYALDFDRSPQDGDNEIEMHDVRVAIDPFSAPYLVGSQVDFVHALMGAGFAIDNPNVVSACGCGSSFRAGRRRRGGAHADACGRRLRPLDDSCVDLLC